MSDMTDGIDPSQVQPGDWVRFVKDNTLVIGEVVHIGKERYVYARKIRTLYTSAGVTSTLAVLEVRR